MKSNSPYSRYLIDVLISVDFDIVKVLWLFCRYNSYKLCYVHKSVLIYPQLWACDLFMLFLELVRYLMYVLIYTVFFLTSIYTVFLI